MAERELKDTIVLFDVDGTLTPSRLSIENDMLETLRALRKKVTIGFVGGSDLSKQVEQIGDDVLSLFDYSFPENGLQFYRGKELVSSAKFIEVIGEEKYKNLVNFILKYIADLDIPVKRGTFVEFRNGMINVSPIGRSCSQQERKAFFELDKVQNIRKKMVEALKEKFSDYNLTYSIGGEISLDIFPKGWDKTYCLNHVKGEGFKTIYFFGDRTEMGGNDYEIYSHPEVIGQTVKNPNDTINHLRKLFLS
ncbi:phosphomannomutase [Neoconidiobolus thromboides FSU 785]|nr:phosphomannomutase [Neoconidiobolus thromboides FSU 785]